MSTVRRAVVAGALAFPLALGTAGAASAAGDEDFVSNIVSPHSDDGPTGVTDEHGINIDEGLYLTTVPQLHSEYLNDALEDALEAHQDAIEEAQEDHEDVLDDVMISVPT